MRSVKTKIDNFPKYDNSFGSDSKKADRTSQTISEKNQCVENKIKYLVWNQIIFKGKGKNISSTEIWSKKIKMNQIKSLWLTLSRTLNYYEKTFL